MAAHQAPVPGILQARTLEWVAISFSNAWKWKGKVKLLSRVRLLVTPWTAAYQAPPSVGFSRQEYWSGVPCRPLGYLPNPGSNLDLVHCRWILYCLSHHRSPRILEWVVYPFSKGSSQPRNRTGVSYIAGRFFTNHITTTQIKKQAPHIFPYLVTQPSWVRLYWYL